MPAVVCWPGVIKPGTIVNEVMSHEDWLPTFLAAAGEPDAKSKLLASFRAGEKTFKNHLDGYNFLPFFRGEVAAGPRHESFYFDDGANLNALRYNDWKVTFQILEGNFFNGRRVSPNMPFVVNLREDPFERFPSESIGRRPVSPILQGVSAESEIRQLRDRSGAAGAPIRRREVSH